MRNVPAEPPLLEATGERLAGSLHNVYRLLSTMFRSIWQAAQRAGGPEAASSTACACILLPDVTPLQATHAALYCTALAAAFDVPLPLAALLLRRKAQRLAPAAFTAGVFAGAFLQLTRLRAAERASDASCWTLPKLRVLFVRAAADARGDTRRTLELLDARLVHDCIPQVALPVGAPPPALHQRHQSLLCVPFTASEDETIANAVLSAVNLPKTAVFERLGQQLSRCVSG